MAHTPFTVINLLFCCILYCIVGKDYINTEITLTFNSTVTRSCATVPVTDDDHLENPENFSAVLSTNTSSVNISPNKAVVTIADNDR